MLKRYSKFTPSKKCKLNSSAILFQNFIYAKISHMYQSDLLRSSLISALQQAALSGQHISGQLLIFNSY
jgi:hypothetical protein